MAIIKKSKDIFVKGDESNKLYKMKNTNTIKKSGIRSKKIMKGGSKVRKSSKLTSHEIAKHAMLKSKYTKSELQTLKKNKGKITFRDNGTEHTVGFHKIRSLFGPATFKPVIIESKGYELPKIHSEIEFGRLFTNPKQMATKEQFEKLVIEQQLAKEKALKNTKNNASRGPISLYSSTEPQKKSNIFSTMEKSVIDDREQKRERTRKAVAEASHFNSSVRKERTWLKSKPKESNEHKEIVSNFNPFTYENPIFTKSLSKTTYSSIGNNYFDIIATKNNINSAI